MSRVAGESERSAAAAAAPPPAAAAASPQAGRKRHWVHGDPRRRRQGRPRHAHPAPVGCHAAASRPAGAPAAATAPPSRLRHWRPRLAAPPLLSLHWVLRARPAARPTVAALHWRAALPLSAERRRAAAGSVDAERGGRVAAAPAGRAALRAEGRGRRGAIARRGATPASGHVAERRGGAGGGREVWAEGGAGRLRGGAREGPAARHVRARGCEREGGWAGGPVTGSWRGRPRLRPPPLGPGRRGQRSHSWLVPVPGAPNKGRGAVWRRDSPSAVGGAVEPGRRGPAALGARTRPRGSAWFRCLCTASAAARSERCVRSTTLLGCERKGVELGRGGSCGITPGAAQPLPRTEVARQRRRTGSCGRAVAPVVVAGSAPPPPREGGEVAAAGPAKPRGGDSRVGHGAVIQACRRLCAALARRSGA